MWSLPLPRWLENTIYAKIRTSYGEVLKYITWIYDNFLSLEYFHMNQADWRSMNKLPFVRFEIFPSTLIGILVQYRHVIFCIFMMPQCIS